MDWILAKLGLNWIKSNPFKSFKWAKLKPVEYFSLGWTWVYIEFDWENKVSKGNIVLLLCVSRAN